MKYLIVLAIFFSIVPRVFAGTLCTKKPIELNFDFGTSDSNHWKKTINPFRQFIHDGYCNFQMWTPVEVEFATVKGCYNYSLNINRYRIEHDNSKFRVAAFHLSPLSTSQSEEFEIYCHYRDRNITEAIALESINDYFELKP